MSNGNRSATYTTTGVAKKSASRVLVNFVTAVAYHFCLNLPRTYSQPGKHSFGDPCRVPTMLNEAIDFIMFTDRPFSLSFHE